MKRVQDLAKNLNSILQPKPQSQTVSPSNSTNENRRAFSPPQTARMLPPNKELTSKLLELEQDERYRYLLMHGNIKHIESETFTLFVELPHI